MNQDHLPNPPSNILIQMHANRDAPPYPVPMKHYGVSEGTKDEVLAALDAAGLDRTAQGRTDKAEAFAEAWREVRDGSTWVEVAGHVYRVVEAS